MYCFENQIGLAGLIGLTIDRRSLWFGLANWTIQGRTGFELAVGPSNWTDCPVLDEPVNFWLTRILVGCLPNTLPCKPTTLSLQANYVFHNMANMSRVFISQLEPVSFRTSVLVILKENLKTNHCGDLNLRAMAIKMTKRPLNYLPTLLNERVNIYIYIVYILVLNFYHMNHLNK